MKKNIRLFLGILRELNYVLNSQQKKRAFKILIIIIISSFLELIGVAIILPYIQAILAPDELMRNKYVNLILKALKIQTSTELFLLIGIGIILLYIFKNVYIMFSNYIRYDYSAQVQKELSLKALTSFMNRGYEYFLDVNSSDILRACTTDIDGVYIIMDSSFLMITEVLNILLIGIFIIYTDIWAACAILSLMSVIMLGIVILFKPAIKKLGRRNHQAYAMKNKAIYQAIGGIKEIFVMQRKDVFVKEYEKAAEISRGVQKKYEFINSSLDRIIEGICVSGLVGIICVRLVSGGNMTAFLPQLAVYAMAAFKVLPSVGKLAKRMNNIVYYRNMLTSLYLNMQEAEQYKKESTDYIMHTGISDEDQMGVSFEDKLQINSIFWKYKNQKEPVLMGADLQIKKGEAIAFIGTSGCGKTTLSDIILGLLRPQEGTVLMDGKDIYAMPKTWARIVGYVPQTVFLMDDTVRKNIVFGAKQNEIDDEKIWQALEKAQLKDFIENLPEQLDTIVGERGIKFSGGQRQRIAIARALYTEPEILVLDEATAALDNDTETAVMESVDALQGKITMIIVAHRLTTIRNCDRIYEITDGKAILKSKEEVFGD